MSVNLQKCDKYYFAIGDTKITIKHIKHK